MKSRGSCYRRFRKSYLLILLVPLLILESVNFFLFRGMTSDSVREMVNQEGRNRLLQIEDQIENIQWIAETYRRKPEAFLDYQTDYVSTVFKLKDDLAQDGRWFAFFSRIYYYNYDRHYAVCSDGAVDEDLLFLRLLHTDEAQDRLQQIQNGDTCFFRARNVKYGKDMVVAASTLDWDSSRNRAKSFLIFTINTETLANLLNIHVDGNALKAVLSYHGTPIYSTDPGWDADIASEYSVDTGHLRSAGSPVAVSSDGGMRIRYFIPSGVFNREIFGTMWKQLLVLLAALGLGFAFISRGMKKNYKPLDRVYRTSMEHSGRPVGSDPPGGAAADELESIDRAMNELLYSRNFLQESNRELQRETLLLALLENRVSSGSALYGSCLDHKIRVDGRSFLYLQMEDAAENAELFALLSGENAVPETESYMIYFEERYYIVMFCSNLSPERLEREVRSVCLEKGGKVCVGSAFGSIDRAGEAYRSLQMDLALEPDRSFDSRDVLADLALAARKKDFAGMENSIDKLSAFFDWGEFPAVYSAFLEASGILSAELSEVGDACRYPSRSVRGSMQMYLAKFYERYRFMGRKEDNADREPPRSHNGEAEKIIAYIEKHFLDTNFSLKSLAAEFGRTPSNLSHFFKKANGQNISQYIEQLKMQRACSMLTSGRYKISEISMILGFGSASAFTEAFKRSMGLTPRAWLSSFSKEKPETERN